MKIQIPEFIPEFLIENDDIIKSLNGKITKKFTSLETRGTLFRWKFGDGFELETTENPIYHEYKKKGLYIVSHQSCIGPLCCSGWCIKSIDITPKPPWASLAIGGFLFFLLIKKECEKEDNVEDCLKHKCNKEVYCCEWKTKEKKCVEKRYRDSSIQT